VKLRRFTYPISLLQLYRKLALCFRYLYHKES
jgi:hypothetical protein